eukprot:s2918_g5.t1
MSRSPNTKTPRSPNSKDISALAKSVRKTPKKHALTDAQVEAAVPDLHGESAPKPELGKAQISEQTVRMRSQRIFRRRTNGSLKVSEEIFNEWHARGARRDMLEEIFLQATFISEVEVIRAEMLENEVVIEGEYASSETMRSWGTDRYEGTMLYYVERTIKGTEEVLHVDDKEGEVDGAGPARHEVGFPISDG